MRTLPILVCVAAIALTMSAREPAGRVPPVDEAPVPQAATGLNVPRIPFDSVANPLRYSPDMNLGEVLGVAVNSKGHVLVLNHPGSAQSGPLYGNASTQLLEFDESGKFLREMGRGVYGLGYAHSVRYDRSDNLWVADMNNWRVQKLLLHPAATSRTAAR